MSGVHTVIRIGDGLSNPLERSPYTLLQTYGLIAIYVVPNPISSRCAYTGQAGRRAHGTLLQRHCR